MKGLIIQNTINYKLFVLNLESLSFRRINGFFLNLSRVQEAVGGGGGYSTVSLVRGGSVPRSNPLSFYMAIFDRGIGQVPLSYIYGRNLSESGWRGINY